MKIKFLYVPENCSLT